MTTALLTVVFLFQSGDALHVKMTSLFLLLVLLGVMTSSTTPTEFPNPQKEWRMCGRPKPSFVCDPDFILERGDAERLDQLAHEFRRSTSCMCPSCIDNIGVSIGIFIKHNVSEDALLKYSTGKDLSEMLRRRWSLSTCDSDIVIILLTQMNMTNFSLGPKVQSILPIEVADEILRDCKIHFNSGWFYQGLESVVNSLNDVVVKMQRQGPHTFKNLVLGIGLGFGVMLILAVTAVILLYRQQVLRRKSNCSDIFESAPRNNCRNPSLTREEHLEKLKSLNASDEDDDEDTSPGEFSFRLPKEKRSSVQFMRMYRQLSDVTEESGEDDVSKRNSGQTSFSSSYYSPKGSVPVTEL